MVRVQTPSIPTADKDDTQATFASVRKEFGFRVSRRIAQKGITQSELSRATGLGRDSISLYKLGKALPSNSNAKKLADALDCTVGDLIPNYEVHLSDERSKGRSPIYLDPSRHPDEARINIAEWLPLDIANKIFTLWVEAKTRSASPPVPVKPVKPAKDAK